MEGFYMKRAELSEKFYNLINERAPEERFIGFINSSLQQGNRLDTKALEVILDLTLVVVDAAGGEHYGPSYSSGGAREAPNTCSADDEGHDEATIFPCQLTFDDCHPELLHDYHYEHLKTTRNSSTQLVKHPKICEFVIDFIFRNLKNQSNLAMPREQLDSSDKNSLDLSSHESGVVLDDSIKANLLNNCQRTLNDYLNSAVNIIKKLDKVCTLERKNCRILSRTNILNVVLNSLEVLLNDQPDRQHIYLDPMLRFAFTLADYRVTGEQVKQIFRIIKNENADLGTVLARFERILDRHYRILKNIQPSKSINFPTALKTAEEIESDPYVSKSWHWRLRSKVIEFKRKQFRQNSESSNEQQDQKQPTRKGSEERGHSHHHHQSTSNSNKQTTNNNNRITPSWLECSMIAPLSNMSPIAHNGQVKFCCSLWMSVCGDLFVIERQENKSGSGTGATTTKTAPTSMRASSLGEECFRNDWRISNGYWLRLTLKKRLLRRYRERKDHQKSHQKKTTTTSRTRRLSMRLRKRQTYDREDEEQEEMEEEARRNYELEQQEQQSPGFRLFPFSTSSKGLKPVPSRESNMAAMDKKSPMQSAKLRQRPPKEFWGRRARDNSQKALMHLVSFAIDTMTIEIWLNVKCMTFCARVCRVAREGQSVLLDQVTFPSHMEANGSWSHVLFCLEETNRGTSNEKLMNLKVKVNGIHKEREKLCYNAHNLPYSNFACLIGCERSTFGYVWKLSQLSLYKQWIPKEVAMFLQGKGPDFWSFTNFKQQSSLVLPDIGQRSIKNLLNPKQLHLYSGCDESGSLNWLTRNIQISFVAHQADHFLDYSSSSSSASTSTIGRYKDQDGDCLNNAERFIQARILNFSRLLKFNVNQGFGQALVEAGGIENVLICFADIIRRSPESPNIHALAFGLLLKLAQTHQHHLNKLLDELNGLKLADFILIHPDCVVSKKMLDYYLKFCLIRKADLFLIKSAKLICNLMSCWRAWHKDAAVAKSLYKKLTRLLQPSSSSSSSSTTRPPVTVEQRKLENYYVDHNFRMMTEAGAIDILMGVLRECLVPLDGGEAPKINQELVELIVNLISLLIKHPPGLEVMFDIMEFLLFLHPDHKSYVELTTDKLAYLRPLIAGDGGDQRLELIYDEGRHRRQRALRTPSSESSFRLSGELNGYSSTRHSGTGRSAMMSDNDDDDDVDDVDDDNDDGVEEEAEEDDLFDEYPSRINEHLVNHIRQFNALSGDNSPALSDKNFQWQLNNEFSWSKILGGRSTGRNGANEDSNRKTATSKRDEKAQKCSNRNFTIASIADMLASIVKLASLDPMRILSEALQKPIIDTRKMVVLVNNNSSLVREKVLGLFLYCLRACYTLNLKSILSKYEEDCKLNGCDRFKICLPVQLMANQLLKYPTTLKMIQMCYGIIVGIDDLETIETVCLIFDIETINNNLQLNALILLMNLMTQLQRPKEMVAAVRFVHAYVRQLVALEADQGVAILIKYNLIDNLMKLYFTYVELEITKGSQKQQQQHQDEMEFGGGHQNLKLKQELDKLLVSIARYFIQNCRLQCVKEQLLDYLDLLNSHVPLRYQFILRDRQVIVLEVMSSYCKLYEESARQLICGGKFLNMFMSFLKPDQLNTFQNSLSEAQLELETISRFQQQDRNSLGSEDLNSSNEELSAGCDGGIEATSNMKKISENEVCERFKITLKWIQSFVLARDVGIIPSQMEREFVFRCLQTFERHLTENKLRGNSSQKCLWQMILQRLEPEIRATFSDLVLFLLSPSDSTINLDERRYCASELLKMFRPEQLVELLGRDKYNKSHKMLLMFIEELMNFNQSALNEPDGSQYEDDDEDEEDDDDTEMKLGELAKRLQYSLESDELTSKGSNNHHYFLSRPKSFNNLDVDAMICDTWLSNLSNGREKVRERCAAMRQVTSEAAASLIGDSGLLLVEATGATNNSQEISGDLNTGGIHSSTWTRLLDEAVKITRDVVDDKHGQRKAYLEDLKQNKVFNYHVRQRWLSLIIGHTHERALWYLEGYYPRSWELNPVEGPSRIRRRLRPCKLVLESRFFRRQSDQTKRSFNADEDEADQEDQEERDDWFSTYSPHPLCSMVVNQEQSADYNELRIRMFTTDKIHFNCSCSIIRPNEVCEGEVSVASWCIHFIGERQRDAAYSGSSKKDNIDLHGSSHGLRRFRLTSKRRRKGEGSAVASFPPSMVEDLWFDEIVEIWERRYQLQEVGLEIFLTNNMTYLLSFRSPRDKEEFKQALMREQHKMINLQRYNLNTSLLRLSQLWRDGRLTNFDYLTCLNKLAGRSFNDLMQYPVFPFVLANYTGKQLDLEEAANFRDLRRPMAVQNPEKEAIFVTNYHDSHCSRLALGGGSLAKPYHYGNHYSNSATVLHFLVRLPPYTQMLIQYQDNNFDQPDRTFHSLASTWQLITRDSNTDFKELIPEFFFLPEMFTNREQFELGRKQNSELVDDVRLPPWCPNSDPRLFTLVHRQALESAHVSRHLHQWIDLIFGFKQTGKAAVEAINVFHPATYYGAIDLTSSELAGSSHLSASKSSTASTVDNASVQQQDTMRAALRSIQGAERQTEDIERLALETMIKTYGQMPRQLFAQPMKQRSLETFSASLAKLTTAASGQPAPPVAAAEQQQQRLVEQRGQAAPKRLEPLRQVRGLRWGSFVGSPDERDIIACQHKQLATSALEVNGGGWRGLLSSKRQRANNMAASSIRSTTISEKKRRRLEAAIRFHLCLLPNGDVACLRENSSLMLDYRADRKSGGSYLPSLATTKYLRRAGLSSVARMNLFSNMIISRQQLSYMEPAAAAAVASSPEVASSSSSLMAFASRVKFSPDSLASVSWGYLDGTIRARRSALLASSSQQQKQLPLLQADSIVDSVSTCASVPELNLLLVGYQSGSICAHIVSTSHETAPSVATASSSSYSDLFGQQDQNAAINLTDPTAAAPSAVHFLHATGGGGGSNLETAPLGPGRVARNSATGQPAYNALFLAGKTLHSVRSTQRTTRWLYCHSQRISCMRINVNFSLLVTGSDDGTCALWDLNSLTYVRTIDYKLPNDNSGHFLAAHLMDYLCQCDQLAKQDEEEAAAELEEPLRFNGFRKLNSRNEDTGTKQGCICASGVRLIAVSDTLGDIVTTKDISSRLVDQATPSDPESSSGSSDNVCTSEDDDGDEDDDDELSESLSSILYCHTINGQLVGLVNCHAQATAVAYSNAPEGVSVNVIAVGMADGLIRLYSSWDLTRVKEIHVSGLEWPVTSLMYSRDSQLLYVTYDDGQLVVLRNRNKQSVSLPKRWIL